jgi:RNA-directed DNA polymerase
MRKTTMTPEPTDKLDIAASVVMNGPEGELPDWSQIDWRTVERNVRRLRQRIFTASKAGDLSRVRRLQKLMLRSRANTLVSVRRVTERNAGRLTAGVDGEVVLTAEAKRELVNRAQHPTEPFTAQPVRRVYIPKPGTNKQRPLGIPVILDRVHQARVVNALEPEWEARFEPRSYGFRPGRGCHDAIQAIYQTVKGRNPGRRWVLDADLAGAFDKVAHDHILAMLDTFPARGMVKQWLRAGVVENGRLLRTEEGTPQGGVVSPVLLNIALHGMEEAAGVSYNVHGWTRSDSPVVIRYADDLLALCHSRQQAEQIKARLAAWLTPRGLSFNEDKTQVVTLDEGFDFLGFNVRRYGVKPLIKPSSAAIRRIRERLRAEMRSLRGINVSGVIKRLNPIIRGWAAYYRTQVSSDTFNALDGYLWKLTYKWARLSHPNKSRHWVISRYFDRFDKSRQDRWVFGNRQRGAYLHKFAWTTIIRHQIVPGRASLDDPSLTEYWTRRRRRTTLPINNTTLRLLRAQDGRCPICKGTLDAVEDRPQLPQQWEHWLATNRTAIVKTAARTGTPDGADLRLTHANCRHGNSPALLPAYPPLGLA